jgi:hypothetical protein
LITTASAERLGVVKMPLSVTPPMLRQDYSLNWETGLPADTARCWRVRFPLMAKDTSAGRLQLLGQRNGAARGQNIDPLLEMVKSVEAELSDLLEGTDHYNKPLTIPLTLPSPFSRTPTT